MKGKSELQKIIMLIYAPTLPYFNKPPLYPGAVKIHKTIGRNLGTRANSSSGRSRSNYLCNLRITSLLAACAVLVSAADALEESQGETLSNIPQMLSGECAAEDCKKPRIQRPKSKKAESCTVKCVNTCIRGGEGSPGEGPLNIRRPIIVFKEGFRSRRYCLVECSDICNLIGDRDDGP